MFIQSTKTDASIRTTESLSLTNPLTKADMTKVIFRTFKDGQVIALFPEIPATDNGWECMSYMHIGQHGAASPFLTHYTRPASEMEYKPLLDELKRIGYDDLKVCKRFGKNDYKTRKELI